MVRHRRSRKPAIAVLPVATLLLLQLGGYTRFMRGAMIETLRQDYVRTARAKGASEPRVLWRHAFANALAPVLTILGLSFGALFSGALITETMFAWPGMGKAIYQGILDNDYNLALVGLLITTFTTIVGNLLADLALVAVDPRVSLVRARAMTAVSLSPGRLVWRRLLRHRLAQVSLVFLAILLVLSLAAPLIAELRGIDPTMTDLLQRFEPPSAAFWLGTDELGRDLFQRLLDGGRVSLLVGFSGALLSAVIGSVIGVVAGYLGGRLDSILMRVTDGVIALPLLPLLIVLAAIDPQKVGIPASIAQSETFSLYRIVVIVALTGWTTVARLVRAETLSLKARDFTRAAQALGARPFAHHVPPHPAQRRGLAGRGHDHVDRQPDPARIDPLLPRPRHPAAGGELGQHADQRAGPAAGGADPGAVAGAADLPHGDRLQLPGRRAAGRPRSAQRAALVSMRSRFGIFCKRPTSASQEALRRELYAVMRSRIRA